MPVDGVFSSSSSTSLTSYSETFWAILLNEAWLLLFMCSRRLPKFVTALVVFFCPGILRARESPPPPPAPGIWRVEGAGDYLMGAQF
jgi:hypothetical protein